MKLRAALLLFSLSSTLATPLHPDVVCIQNNSKRAIWVYHGPWQEMPNSVANLINGGIEIPPTTSFNFEYTPKVCSSYSPTDTAFTIVDRLVRKKDGITIGTRAQFNLPDCPNGLLITFNSDSIPRGETTALSTYPTVPFNPDFANFSCGTLVCK